MRPSGNDAPPFRVLFVCTANQCRSAMAEAIARHEVTLGLAAPLQFSSAGTHAMPGLPATPETLHAVSELGLDLSRHRSRELTRPRVQAAGLVLTMTRSHIRFVSAVVPEAADRTFTLMQFWRVAAGESAASVASLVDLARRTAEHTRKDDILDPVGRGEEAFRACAARLRLLIRPVVGALAAAAWRDGAATPRRRPATPRPPQATRPSPKVPVAAPLVPAKPAAAPNPAAASKPTPSKPAAPEPAATTAASPGKPAAKAAPATAPAPAAAASAGPSGDAKEPAAKEPAAPAAKEDSSSREASSKEPAGEPAAGEPVAGEADAGEADADRAAMLRERAAIAARRKREYHRIDLFSVPPAGAKPAGEEPPAGEPPAGEPPPRRAEPADAS